MRVILARCEIAPASDRWYATDRDLDLDVPVGSGATPLQAIENLLWRLHEEEITPEQCDIVWT
jgi:hypothetical protein